MSSRKAGTLPKKLGTNNKGPVGPRYSKGVPYRIPHNTPPDSEAAPSTNESVPGGHNADRIAKANNKTSSDRGHYASRGCIPLHPLLSTQEGRGPTSGNQPETPQLLRTDPPFQNGGNARPEEPPTGGRLACKGRPERCLLFCPDTLGAQEIPELHSRQHLLPVHLPPIRSGVSPLGLYQDPQTSHSSRERAGDADDSLYRRHPPLGRIRGEGSGPCRRPSLSPTMPGLHDQSGEDDSRAIPEHGIPGIHSRHQENGTELTSREAQEDSGGVPKTNGGGASDWPHPFETNRQDECCQPGHPTSASFLQESANGIISSPEGGRPGLRDNDHAVGGQQGGAGMVGHRNGEMEREDNSSPRTSYGNRVGRIEARLGSVLPRNQYRGTLVSPGEEPTYQLPGAPGSYSSAADLCKERERGLSSAENRQHGSSCLYQQSRGNSVEGTSLPHQKTLDVVPGEEYSHTGTAPPRCHESNSRCRIESNEGSVRLEIGSTGIPEDQQCLRTTGSGSLCIPTDQSVPPLLQLAARSISRGHGCILPELGGNEGVCQPSLEPNISCISENTDSRSRPDSGGSNMEGTTMVCSATVNVGGLATPAASTVSPHLGINPHTTQTGRMEHLRERLHGQGLSGQATQLILQSWRTKTNKSYDSLFGRWSRWCGERGSDPFSGPVTEVANFLATLYQEGYQYNSVNAYRSAISSVHEKVEGVVIGQHPIITRLLKGIYNVRPPLPRYNGTWNVQTALNYLESLGETKNLTLKLLTMKTVFLLAITRPSRSADLSQLDIERMKTGTNGITFLPASLAKQSRQGRPIAEFFFPSFQPNATICPVHTLQAYLTTTRPLRGAESRLFVSFIKPHKAVTSSTIARWLRITLEQSGIDSSIFGAHSTRGASASAAAKGGITTEDILKAANWSSESVFQRFYHKEVDKAAYGRAVIDQNSSE